MTRAGAALALAAVLVTAGCSGGGGLTTRERAIPQAGGATWQPCPELVDEVLPPGSRDAEVRYDCATVTVPQDWDQPESSGTFTLELVRARSHDQADRIGSLLVNPGGPGGSGIETAVYLSLGPSWGGLPQAVTQRFDVVGFDPRGVGRSSPVECFTDEDLDEWFAADPDPASQAAFDQAVVEIERQGEQCEAKYGEALSHFSTRQTAHDLDAIRAAVGDEQLTYLGYSYGTLLGAVYAHLYPDNVRALVLDGAIDPREDRVTASLGQAEGFERALDRFTDWCGGRPEACPLQPDARTAITDAIEAARADPVPGTGDRNATAGWIFLSVLATLYSQDAWPHLATALDRLGQGDPRGVFALADAYAQRGPDGHYTNLFDANSAVSCADERTELTIAEVRSLQELWRREHPFFGAPLATGLVECILWPADPDPYPVGPAEGAPPILVVGTTGDPATPYESTPKLAELLGTGVVLTWEGEGHTAYPESECVNEAVDAYLIDLTVPAEGTTCPAG